MGSWKIDINCVIMHPLDWHFFHWHSFELLELLRMDYFFKQGASSLGGCHGGVIGGGHQPMGTHVDIPMEGEGGLECWVLSGLYTTLYEQQHQLPPMAQEALYQQPHEVLLKQPAPKLQTWTQCGLWYFTQQLRAAKSLATLQNPDIHTFFHQITQQTNDIQPPWETLFHWTSVGLLCMQ